jgi:hypothetical protein
MNGCLELVPLAKIIARTIMMSFVSAGAIFSIYLGWRLYQECVKSTVFGELQTNRWKFKFVAAGPGVVLAAFGAWLLSLVAVHPFDRTIKETIEIPPTAFRSSAKSNLSSFILDEGFQKIAATGNPNSAKSKADPPQPCRCAPPLRISREEKESYMDGHSKEPTYTEIKAAIELALESTRAGKPTDPEKVKAKRSAVEALEYLREIAMEALQLESSQKRKN